MSDKNKKKKKGGVKREREEVLSPFTDDTKIQKKRAPQLSLDKIKQEPETAPTKNNIKKEQPQSKDKDKDQQKAKEKSKKKEQLKSKSKQPAAKSREKKERTPRPKPEEPEQTLNQMQRQYSKISRKKVLKSNFYLQKEDYKKWGFPVGRGTIKMRKQFEDQLKEIKDRQKKRKKIQKQLIEKQFPLSPKKNNQQKEQNRVKIEAPQQTIANEVKKENTNTDHNTNSTLKYEFPMESDQLNKFIKNYSEFGMKFIDHQKQEGLSEFEIKVNLRHLINQSIDYLQQKIREIDETMSLWKPEERKIIMRQCFNFDSCLLSSDLFRQNFNLLLQEAPYAKINISTNLPIDFIFLWTFLRQFVQERKNQLEVKKEALQEEVKRQEVDGDHLLQQYPWIKQEENALVKLFEMYGDNYDQLCNKLEQVFYPDPKWQQTVRYKLHQLQRGLTTLPARPSPQNHSAQCKKQEIEAVNEPIKKE